MLLPTTYRVMTNQLNFDSLKALVIENYSAEDIIFVGTSMQDVVN